jgi:4'-phosphopantetheinyl transferase
VNVSQARLEPLQTWLSPDELSRSDTFRSAEDCRAFIAARGVLREILARYLDRLPQELRFGYGPRGKPFLKPDTGLRFNLSHSGGVALYAVAINREVGIDIELVQPHSEWEEIAQRQFLPHDVSRLRAMPADWRNRGFFELWTRGEAHLKAGGEGFFGSSISEQLFCMSLEVWPGYAAAVAAQGSDWEPKSYDWRPEP